MSHPSTNQPRENGKAVLLEAMRRVAVERPYVSNIPLPESGGADLDDFSPHRHIMLVDALGRRVQYRPDYLGGELV